MRVRRTWPIAFLLMAPVLAACGDDADPDPAAEETTASESPSETTSEASTEATTETTTTEATTDSTSGSAAADTLPAACDTVTVQDVAAAYGVDFVPGGVGGGSTSEQGVEWSSDNCSFEATDLVEVTIKLTGPDDFTAGGFQCPQPTDIGAIVEPVDDIAGAEEGWWKVGETPPLEATMRACTESFNVDIDVEYEDGVDYQGDPRNQSVVLAETVLANING